MNPTRILIIDDEPQIVRAIKTNLEARDYQVHTASDGREGLRLIGDIDPDLVILDLGLPRMSGIDVLVQARQWTQTPILVVSARSGDQDKIAALDSGADDYITKPFSIGELMARVRANLRRRPADTGTSLLQTPDFTIDFSLAEVRRGDELIHLTPLEWKIVAVLANSEGKLVTQRALLHAVWGPQYGDETGYLRVHLTHIRRKLEPVPAQPRYFRTEPGIGYRFHANTSDGAPSSS